MHRILFTSAVELKDRGDGFMRDKNYSSALDAYN